MKKISDTVVNWMYGVRKSSFPALYFSRWDEKILRFSFSFDFGYTVNVDDDDDDDDSSAHANYSLFVGFTVRTVRTIRNILQLTLQPSLSIVFSIHVICCCTIISRNVASKFPIGLVQHTRFERTNRNRVFHPHRHHRSCGKTRRDGTSLTPNPRFLKT